MKSKRSSLTLHSFHYIIVALAVLLTLSPILGTASLAQSQSATLSGSTFELDMKVLVVSVYDNPMQDLRLPVILAGLRGYNIPYDTYFAFDKATQSCKTEPLALTYAPDPNQPRIVRGKYYAMIYSSYGLPWLNNNGTSVDCLKSQRQALEAYRTRYGVRLFSAYTMPGEQFNLRLVQANAASTILGFNSTFATRDFLRMNTGLKANARFEIPQNYAWHYIAAIKDPTLSTVTPILDYIDPTSNNVIGIAGAIILGADHKEEMHFFFDSNDYSIYGLALTHLWIHWLTRDLYLGWRRVLLNPQVDDLFLATKVWDVVNHGPSLNTYRMKATDLQALVNWQTVFNDKLDQANGQQPNTNQITTEFAWNLRGLWPGDPSEMGSSIAAMLPTDDYGQLLAAVQNNLDRFHWVSHSWRDKDQSCPDAACVELQAELKRNLEMADAIIFKDKSRPTTYSPTAFVSPGSSGLFNKFTIQAWRAASVTSVMGDATRVELWPYPRYLNGGSDGKDWPPEPYANHFTAEHLLEVNWHHGRWLTEQVNGYADPTWPILLINRFATNVYNNVTTEDELASEYNYFYGPNGIIAPFYPVPQTAEQIWQSESQQVVRNLLVQRWDPYMFHQANVRTTFNLATTEHSLLTKWLAHVVMEYNKYMTLPIRSLKQADLAALMAERMNRDLDCNLQAYLRVAEGKVTTVHVETALTGKTQSNECVVRVSNIAHDHLSQQTLADPRISFDVLGADSTAVLRLPAMGTMDLQWEPTAAHTWPIPTGTITITTTNVQDGSYQYAHKFRFDGDLGPFTLSYYPSPDSNVFINTKTSAVMSGAYTITQQNSDSAFLTDIICSPVVNRVVDLATQSVTITANIGDNITCNFINQNAAKLAAYIYNDHNHNHVPDSGDEALSGWVVQLRTTPDAPVLTQITDAGGRASFYPLRPGSYTICEAPRRGWFNITPPNKSCYSITMTFGKSASFRFGNSTTPLVGAAEAGAFNDVKIMNLPDTDDDGNEVAPLPDPWPDAVKEPVNALFLPLVSRH